MQLFGYISTTEDEATAYQFAWDDPEKEKVKVVFKINFKSAENYFVMELGNHCHEKEILLTDGTPFVT